MFSFMELECALHHKCSSQRVDSTTSRDLRSRKALKRDCCRQIECCEAIPIAKKAAAYSIKVGSRTLTSTLDYRSENSSGFVIHLLYPDNGVGSGNTRNVGLVPFQPFRKNYFSGEATLTCFSTVTRTDIYPSVLWRNRRKRRR